MVACRYGAMCCYKVGDRHHRQFTHNGRPNRSTCRLFHGTKYENAGSILQGGLRESKEGRLGRGVYLTTKKWAQRIAAHRGNGKNLCLIEVEVDLGNLKKLSGQEDDPTGKWSRHSSPYNSCRTMHPAWSQVTTKPFPEICVRNPQRWRIVGMTKIGTFTANGTIVNCNEALAISAGGAAHAVAHASGGSAHAVAQASAVSY